MPSYFAEMFVEVQEREGAGEAAAHDTMERLIFILLFKQQIVSIVYQLFLRCL